MTDPASIAIIGCGFGGVTAAIELRRAGIADFVIFERAGDVAGVDEFDLRADIRFGTEVTEAAFDDAAGGWTLTFGNGRPPASFDVLIWCTGNAAGDLVAPVVITGRGGLDIRTHWEHGAHAYFGVSTIGFPNLFLLLGTSTTSSTDADVFVSERQAAYIRQAIEHKRRHRLPTLEVRRDVYRDFQKGLDRSPDKTAAAGPDGTTTARWPQSPLEYTWASVNFRPGDYAVSHRPLNYTRVGQGEPLILIHGTAGHLHTWNPVIAELATRFDVIAVDLPGCGGTAISGSYAIADQADSVVRLMDSLGIDRAHLAGNSLGGTLALEIAARGRARSVIAFSPAGFWSRPGRVWFQVLMRGIHALGSLLRPVLPVLLRNTITRTALFGPFVGRAWTLPPEVAEAEANAVLDSAAFAGTLAAFWTYRADSRIDTVAVPTTIAWGKRDALLTYPTQSRRAARALPAAIHIPLPRCGHIPFFDDPTRCAELIASNALPTEHPRKR
ncbi:alpha/beta fold hydrolase [Nocardia sp. NPDC058379]|uniref:alpha/beta fold hydrolase n=1 Tax=unclassified Nocardia TaxID=2637762 RepID=UPI0036691C54